MNDRRPARRPTRAWVNALVAGVLVAACATVADLDVEPAREPAVDRDDVGRDDASAEGGRPDGAVAADGGADAAADAAVLVACGCSFDKGCCLLAGGGRSCVAPGDVTSCTGSGGLFFRCAAGDVENGRSCCLAKDLRSSFFGPADCEDAGGTLCGSDAECGGGHCQPMACRSVVLGVCTANEAGPVPACP